MEFVKEENLIQHHVNVLNQCAYDLSKVTGDRVRFAERLEKDLVWHLNDWALDEYKDYVSTLMHCIDLYNQGKPSPSAEDIVQYTYNLAELISLNAQEQAKADAKAARDFAKDEVSADIKAFCANLGDKASEVMGTVKSALPEEIRNLSKDDIRAVAGSAGIAAKAAGTVLKGKAKTYGTAAANWFMSQLTQEFHPEEDETADGTGEDNEND